MVEEVGWRAITYKEWKEEVFSVVRNYSNIAKTPEISKKLPKSWYRDQMPSWAAAQRIYLIKDFLTRLYAIPAKEEDAQNVFDRLEHLRGMSIKSLFVLSSCDVPSLWMAFNEGNQGQESTVSSQHQGVEHKNGHGGYCAACVDEEFEEEDPASCRVVVKIG